tara:strand:- start:4314 stop:5015 length:702 start_codon:yes stop_codon:yes gene_type:complete
MTSILALDATSQFCSAGLLHSGRIDFECNQVPRAAAKALLPMIDSLLKNAGKSLSQLDLIAVSAGPGSFTGVRIGLGVAQGLGESAGVKVLAISSLAHVAFEASIATGKKSVGVFMNARDGEYYFGSFQLFPEKCEFLTITEQVVSSAAISDELLIESLSNIGDDCVLTGDALQSLLQSKLQNDPFCSIKPFTPPGVSSLCELAQLMMRSVRIDKRQVAQANYVKEMLNYPKS